MRLISATVRNYRIHQELAVEFDERITVLGGPNEVGKSTLVEAIHRVLFLPHRTTGALREAMRSHGGGIPEVELAFAIGEDRYRLRKRFNGPSGSIDLEGPDGERWRSDAAETKLAELLSEPSTGTGRGASRIDGRWEHVWVFQGQATADPVERTANQHEALIQRLQELGGGALVQSARDAAVAKRVNQAFSRIWTEKGSLRQNADAVQARTRLEAAARERDDALRDLEKLDDAVRRLDAATARLAERPSEGLKAQLAQQQQLARRLEQLEQQLTRAEEKVAQARQALDDYVRRCDLADDAEAALAMQASETAAVTEKLAQASAVAASADQRVQTTEHELRGVQETAREARRRRAMLQKQADLRQAAKELADAQESLADAQRWRADRGSAMERLAGLPLVSEEDCSRLRDLEVAVAKTVATLEAMVARVELLASDQPVQVDGRELAVGESQVLTAAADLTIGNSVRMRLFPGGGGTVLDAQRVAEAAQEALTVALADCGVASSKAADEVLRERGRLDAVVVNANAALQRHASIESLVAELEARVGTLKAVVDANPDGQQVFPDLVDTETELAEATALEQQLDDQLAELQAVLETQRTEAARCRQATSVLREEEQTANLERARIQTQIEGLILELGDNETRAERQRHLQGVVDEAAKVMQRLDGEADELRAAEPDAAVERLLRALQRAEELEGDAREKRAAALEILRSDGTLDPNRRVAESQAAVVRAQQAADSEQLRADAIRMLQDEFQTAQEDLAKQYAAPLRNKVREYLRPLFGAGVGVRFQVHQDRFDALALGRAGDEFAFNDLSGGTKEQVSVAFRLAMVEILAARFAYTLPIVLDDAFAYSDPERLPRVHGMLDRAARNGVQVIILSCTPGDYLGLGGCTLLLSPPLSRREANGAQSDDIGKTPEQEAPPKDIGAQDLAPSVPPEVMPSPSAVAAPPGSEIMTDLLVATALDTIRANGGSMGNQSLRLSLGCSPEQYEQIKEALLLTKMVKRGAGRGGTLVLTGDAE
jgi:hypothetical protein